MIFRTYLENKMKDIRLIILYYLQKLWKISLKIRKKAYPSTLECLCLHAYFFYDVYIT